MNRIKSSKKDRKKITGGMKNLLIAVLVVLSVVQTEVIWFDGRSFSDVVSAFSFAADFTPSKEVLDILATPTRILTKTGEDNFISSCSDLKNNPLKAYLDEIMPDFFKKAEYAGDNGLDLKAILSASDLIYSYEFSIPADVFTECFGSKSNILTQRLKNIDYITLRASESGDSVIFCFVSKTEGKFKEFRLSGSEQAEGMANSVLRLTVNPFNVHYRINTPDDGSFSDESFIACWENEFEYFNIGVVNPYAENDSVMMTSVLNKVRTFFDNASNILSDIRNESSYAYSGGRVVVKYDGGSRLLEYSDYSLPSKKISDSFLSSFSAAYSVLKKDESLANEYSLSEYSYDGTNWYFGFDYVILDMPVFFSKKTAEQLNMKHLLEVTVRDDIAANYKHIAVNLTPDFVSFANGNFSDAVNFFASAGIGDDIVFSDLKLGYRLDEGTQFGLYWNVLVSGKENIVPLQ